MSQIEVVTPIEHDGIELYVSADGKESGMSVRALSRFCGVPRTTLTSLFNKLNVENYTDDLNLNNYLKPFIGEGFSRTIKGDAGSGSLANIVPYKTCEAVISYYAYISPRTTEDVKKAAMEAHRKFAQYGLHQWICNAVGFIEKQNDSELLSLVKEVLVEVKELREVATEYKIIREKTTTYLPGADNLLDNLKESHELTTSDGAVSLEYWLFEKGIRLSTPQLRRLSQIVCDTYRSLTKSDPQKAHCKVNGKVKYNVSVFKPEHFPILQIGLNKLFA